MRSEAEIINKTEEYKLRLARAVAAKNQHQPIVSDNDLLILALVDKLETLFWVLDIELPGDDAIDTMLTLYN